MSIWQADCYRRPLQNEFGKSLWELVLCNPDRTFEWSVLCPQPEVNSTWLSSQILEAINLAHHRPERIQVFRPQALSLIQAACQTLEIPVEPTRRTPALKQWLQEKAQQYSSMVGYTGQPYQPISLEKPPPVPLPENLWGEQWRFAALPAGDLEAVFRDRPIPVVEVPNLFLPISLPANLPVPGVVIDAGRRSLRLARWLQEAHPVSLHYIPGEPDGLILEAGLADRWVVTTFTDPDVQAAAQIYEQRKQQSQGLHFLLVQPDDSGMTYSGFWLLRPED
ncbi:MAG: Tab2/Atab2 family RNA-binding protein [Leptolyngbyaceae bacterium]|nr:Tab2/Atab2 family RNA-binding protein [Leptolyngbyaceae bacterium]